MSSNTFLDVYASSLNKSGEELCGDKVKVFKTADKTTLILSDGMGSGVKANILATLTAEIILTMLKESAAIEDVIETVIGTLPIDANLHIAYSTFTVIEIHHATNKFRLINFDNPEPFFLKQGKIFRITKTQRMISGKRVFFSEGTFEEGDFLGIMSDGVLFAGPEITLNQDWNWDHIAHYMEELFKWRVFNAHSIVNKVITQTRLLYNNRIGDDATFAGLYLRKSNALMVFTGPPLDIHDDGNCVDKLLDFPGKKVICGGTTSNIVASFLKAEVETDLSTRREGIPPIGSLKGIDLVTEGILTMAKTLEYLKQSKGDLSHLTRDNNGAYLLTRELLLADQIYFLVGQTINPYYQNPLLPDNVSIRKNLVLQIADILSSYNKEIHLEYC